MKRLLKAAAALVCAFGFTFAHAQLTTITAAHINMGGVPIAAGMVTYTPVNASGIPIPFATGGGGLNSPTAFSGTITAGAVVAGFQVPDACLTSPANILYTIQITNTATQKSFTLQGVPNVCGSSWALDQYGPPATTTNVQPIQVSYGTSAPASSCVPPSFYVRNYSGGQLWMCVASVFVQVTGSGGSSYTFTNGLTNASGTVSPNYGTSANTVAQGNDSRFAANAAAAASAQATANAALPAPSAQSLSTIPHILTTGLMALYVPSSCAGGVYTDISGNGNNGTLATSTAAPTCNANGVSFAGANHQYIALPASLNAAKTIQIFTIPLVAARGAATGAVATGELIGSAVSAGEHIFGRTQISPGGPFNDSTAVYAGGYTTSINDVTSLPSLYTWDLSCTLDHVYINDQEATSYYVQGTTCNKQTTSNLQLGGSAGNGANFSSTTISVAVFYSTELTAQQVASNYQAIKSYLQNTVGLSFALKPNGGSTPTLVCSGDSITNGNGTTTPATQSWCTSTVLSPLTTTAFNIVNLGAGYGTMNAFISEGESREDTVFAANAGLNFDTVFFGTNDAGVGAATPFLPPGAFNLIMAFANRRAAGPTHPTPILVTMLSRTGNTGAGTNYDIYKNQLNALIRGQKTYPVLDMAEVAALGADGAYASFTDGIHPTTAQNVIMAQTTANLLNYLTGTTAANPTVLTASGTLTWSQARVVRAVPAANMTITLPACDGPTGQTVTIINTQSASGTYTVGVTAATGQTVNGVAAGTNVTVPDGGSLILSDQLNAASTGGCHWEAL
jgi:lysophospholipase L1-like esterase